LADVPKEHYPSVGVVGIAGAVIENKVQPVNCPWPLSDGYEIAEVCRFKSFLFINDFLAAGYGVSRLKTTDCTKLNPSKKAIMQEKGLSVKAVIGPGTGLG
jgi:glucokinase